MKLRLRDLGSMDYGRCWDLQRQFFDALLAAKGAARSAAAAEQAKAAGGQHATAAEQAKAAEGQHAGAAEGQHAGAAEGQQTGAESLAGTTTTKPQAGAAKAVEADAEDVGTLLLVEHPPVYTLGKSGHAENLLVGREMLERLGAQFYHIDRGGDITFHAPGQMVVYPLLDLRRRHLFVKTYVSLLLETLIDTLAAFGIESIRHPGAPGVYVPMPGGMGEFSGIAKIASIGIHVSRGSTLHGIALNVHTDLAGFRRIAPCGYSGLRVTNMMSLGADCDLETVKGEYRQRLLRALNDIQISSNHD